MITESYLFLFLRKMKLKLTTQFETLEPDENDNELQRQG